MEEEEVVYLKVFDKEKGDVVFEGKVSTDVEPHELVKLKCFRERGFHGIFRKVSNEEVESFQGLQNNVELVAGGSFYKYFSGVLYFIVEDGVLRKSKIVPSCECVMMSLWYLSHEECEKVFKCEALEELEMYYCKKVQIPHEIVKLKKMKKLRLEGLRELQSIPEEIGELSNLEELRVAYCGVESLPKRLKDLKKMKSISLVDLSKLRLNAEDLVLFSKLRHLTMWHCENTFTPLFTQAFWQMIKSTTDLRVLDLIWDEQNEEEMVVAAFEENGSIVDGGKGSESYTHIFKRNKENHERALQCVVHMLANQKMEKCVEQRSKGDDAIVGHDVVDNGE